MYCEVVDSLWAFGLFHTVQPRGADVLSWKTESPTPRVAADQPPPNITFTYTTNLKGVINYDFETERWYRTVCRSLHLCTPNYLPVCQVAARWAVDQSGRGGDQSGSQVGATTQKKPAWHDCWRNKAMWSTLIRAGLDFLSIGFTFH